MKKERFTVGIVVDLSAVFLVGLCLSFAAESGSNQSAPADWSAAKELTVPSPDGPVKLLRRVRSGGATRAEWISHPSTRETWIGGPADAYLIVGGKIWGFSPYGWNLRLRESQHYGESPGAEDKLVQEFSKGFEADPGAALWAGSNVKLFDFERVFARSVVFSGAEGRMDILTTTGALCEGGRAVVNFRSRAGNNVSLTFDAQARVVAACCNGQPVPILLESLLPKRELREWGVCGNKSIPSSAGPLTAAFVYRSYEATSGQGAGPIEVANVFGLVLTNTGYVWIGPSDCQQCVLDGRILGVRVSGGRELEVFAGPRARVPILEDAGRSFRGQLLNFEREFQAKGLQWQPDFHTNIVQVFGKGERWPEGGEFSLRSFTVRKSGVAATLNTSDSRQVELVFDKALRLISAEILFGKLPWRAGKR